MPHAAGEIPETSVRIVDRRWSRAFPRLRSRLTNVVARTLETACPGSPSVAVSIGLFDDAELQRLNRTWRHQDKPTNVLSFGATAIRAGELPPRAPGGFPLELGDIALAFETCLAEAEAHGKPPQDHLDHLVVHGTLHLLGYDHEVEADALIMEALERRILGAFGIADPYRIDAIRHSSPQDLAR